MKKILCIGDSYGGHGGIAQVARDFLSALHDEKLIDRAVVLPRGSSDEDESRPGSVEVERRAGGGLSRFVAALARRLARERYDLVYCTHINLAPFAWAAARISRCPWLLSLHGVEAWTPTARGIANRAAARADLLLPVSRFTQDRFTSWCAVPADRCHVLPNAVRLDRFGVGEKNRALVERLGLDGRRVLMTLGRLDAAEKAKGFDRVIELLPALAERVPNISYMICGTGNDRSRLEALAASKGVEDRVVFTGRIPEEEKADHYRIADAYVMPSVWEGFGLVFVEAMACGIPVIASSRDAGAETVLNGKLGQVVDPFDAAQLEQAIMTALFQPRLIPSDLDRFSYANFKRRLRAAIEQLPGRPLQTSEPRRRADAN